MAPQMRKRELLECNKRRMISPVANILIRKKIVAAKGGGKYYDQTSAITYYDRPSAITNYVTITIDYVVILSKYSI